MKPKKRTRRTASSTDPVTAYAKSVFAGEIIAGPHVRAACKRHLNDLEHGHKRGLTFDRAAAEEEIAFFAEVLCLNGGQFEGKPFVLIGWQEFCVGSVFGWKRQDGTRRFRIVYIETAKGSGKSPLAAGVGLKLLCADNEPRAEIYAAAVKQDQAKVLFRDAVAMVQQSPKLRSRLMLSGGTNPDNIAHTSSASFFRPISSERQGRGQSGPRPHGALLDEIHEHPTNATVEFMAAGVKWRRQPLNWMITNSGSDRQTVCWEYHQYGAAVSAGTIANDEFFAYICSLDPGDDPFSDETCWPKANPSLPEIPGHDYIRGEVTKARGMPSKESLVRRLNFCQWTDAADAWITKDLWFAVNTKLELDDYAGRECYGGLDLSLSSDLTALVLAFPMGDRKFDVFSWFWMPGDRLLELENKDGMAPNYQTWRNDGHLLAPSGKTIDYAHAAQLIAGLAARFKIKAIAYDRAKIELLRGELDKIGCDVRLIEHGQGFYRAKDSGLWMPGSIDELEAAIREQRIQVNENPVLSWCVASAVCQQSNIQPADRYFSKKKASGRIDGAVALAEAIGATTAKLETGVTSEMLIARGGLI
jgi:phage terminase large subunit-like protein